MAEPKFHIRDAEAEKQDAQFILAAFDSSLPHLNATGSERQWGTEPLSAHPSFPGTITSAVEDAETYRRTGEGNLVEVRVAEVDAKPGEFPHVEGARMRVGGIVVKDGWWPAYVAKDEDMAGKIEGVENWACVYVLISDFRAGAKRKGAGAALVAEAAERARARGKGTLFVDCWAGNGRKLVR